MRSCCAALAATILLASCIQDETVVSYGGADRLWRVTEINGAGFEKPATLRFAGQGTVEGRGPCNSYTARMVAPYPWFELGPIRTPQEPCPDSATENRLFAALRAMTLVEVLGDTMILSNDAGDSIILKSGG